MKTNNLSVAAYIGNSLVQSMGEYSEEGELMAVKEYVMELKENKERLELGDEDTRLMINEIVSKV